MNLLSDNALLTTLYINIFIFEDSYEYNIKSYL